MKKCLIVRIQEEPGMAIQVIPPSNNLRRVFCRFADELGFNEPRFVWRFKGDMEKVSDEEPLIPTDYVCHGICHGDADTLIFLAVLFNSHIQTIEYLEFCHKVPAFQKSHNRKEIT